VVPGSTFAPPADLDHLLRRVDVVVSPELVADLHRPGLIISPAFLGPDRRSPVGWHPPVTPPPARRRLLEIAAVAAVTVAAVVPLTLMVSHPAVASLPASSPGPAAVGATSAARVPGHPGRGRHLLRRHVGAAGPAATHAAPVGPATTPRAAVPAAAHPAPVRTLASGQAGAASGLQATRHAARARRRAAARERHLYRALAHALRHRAAGGNLSPASSMVAGG
jgi:hypothetical protein